MMKIFAYPKNQSAYCQALYAAIEAQGLEVVDGRWEFGWAVRNFRRGSILHLNWPSFLYGGCVARVRAIYLALKFAFMLLFAKSVGAKIWWTAHNLMPHESSPIPGLDTLMRLLVIWCSDVIYVHGAEAMALLLEEFPAAKGKCELLPHGNWIDFYSKAPSRIFARNALNLNAAGFVYLFLGQCRRYKNITALVDAFLASARSGDVLLIAGSFNSSKYLEEVVVAAAGDPRVRIDAGFIPDEKLPIYLGASDVVCIPYKEILTSGSAMLAMSFGRPVVSVDRGFLRDVINSPHLGVLVPVGDQGALIKALADVRRKIWDEQDILCSANQYTFKTAADVMIRMGSSGA